MHSALSPGQLSGLHTRMDEDRDGRVSVAELTSFAHATQRAVAKSRHEGVLGGFDKDGDGRMSLEEYMLDVKSWHDHLLEEDWQWEIRLRMEEKKFKAADENGDDHIEESELTGLLRPETNLKVLKETASEMLQLKDTDRNGKLSKSEFTGIVPEAEPDGHYVGWGEPNDHVNHTAEAPEEEEDEEEDPYPEDAAALVPGPDEAATEAEEKPVEADFRLADRDGDGALTTEELFEWELRRHGLQEAIAHIFHLSDQDGDGHLTTHELHDAREAIAENASMPQDHLEEWAWHHEL